MQQFQRPVARIGLVFALVIVAYFLDVIDFSIVQVALPSMRATFLASLADIQWVVSAYALTLAGFLLFMGRAGDVYGQKKIFVTGLVIFTIASLSGGLAPSLLILVIFRGLQGIGAAMTTVTAFAIFIGLFPEGPERNRAFGILIAVLSGGFAAGSVAGGVLTTFLGWRSVMFVNVPIGIVAAIACQRFLPSFSNKTTNYHMDVAGALTVTVGTSLVVYGLTNASTIGFVSFETLLPLVVSAFVLGSFVAIESRSRSPLLPLDFLRRGSVLTANTLALVFTSIIGGVSVIITVYLQTVLGYSALYAGLGILPAALIFLFVGGWGAAKVIDRFGVRRPLVVSAVMVSVGVALLTQITPQSNYFVIVPGLMVWAFGASIGFPAVNIAAIAGTKHGEEGLASGVVNTSFRIGFPLGLSVLLTIASAFDPPTAPTASGLVTGFQYALATGALLGLLGLAIAFWIKDVEPAWKRPVM
jgi:EmrB/QacA subfamily drug resistance transporter